MRGPASHPRGCASSSTSAAVTPSRRPGQGWTATSRASHAGQGRSPSTATPTAVGDSPAAAPAARVRRRPSMLLAAKIASGGSGRARRSAAAHRPPGGAVVGVAQVQVGIGAGEHWRRPHATRGRAAPPCWRRRSRSRTPRGRGRARRAPAWRARAAAASSSVTTSIAEPGSGRSTATTAMPRAVERAEVGRRAGRREHDARHLLGAAMSR